MGESVYRQLSAQAVWFSANHDDAASLQKWNEAAAAKPLQWEPYFERARVKLRLGYSSREALDDFARARHLEPHNANLCRLEYDTWERHDPVYGIPAFQEVLRRDPPRAVEYFRGHVAKVQEHPELRRHMLSIAKSDPKLLLAYLPSAAATEFQKLIDDLLAAHSSLQIFTPEDRVRFFQLWYERGNAAQLIARLEENPLWQKDGWSVLAAHKAKQGDLRAAYEVALKNVPKPRERAPHPPRDLAELTRAFELAPSDFNAGLDLYEAQRRADQNDAALATLDQLAKLLGSPAHLLFERAQTLAAKGDFAAAWTTLRDYGQRLQREQAPH